MLNYEVMTEAEEQEIFEIFRAVASYTARTKNYYDIETAFKVARCRIEDDILITPTTNEYYVGSMFIVPVYSPVHHNNVVGVHFYSESYDENLRSYGADLLYTIWF